MDINTVTATVTVMDIATAANTAIITARPAAARTAEGVETQLAATATVMLVPQQKPLQLIQKTLYTTTAEIVLKA